MIGNEWVNIFEIKRRSTTDSDWSAIIYIFALDNFKKLLVDLSLKYRDATNIHTSVYKYMCICFWHFSKIMFLDA